MKRNSYFILTTLVFFSSTLFGSDFGIGIYGGKDFYNIPDLQRKFQLLDLTEASINRDGFANPWMIGVSLSFNANQNWMMRISGDVAMVKYDVLFTRNNPTFANPFYVKTSVYKIDWGRAAILATIERHRRLDDHFNFFAGAGGGMYILAPVVSDKFLVNTVLNKFMELDVSKDIEMSYKFSLHAALGIEVTTLGELVSFRIQGRYNFMSEGRYEEPTRFFSSSCGIIFNIKF